ILPPNCTAATSVLADGIGARISHFPRGSAAALTKECMKRGMRSHASKQNLMKWFFPWSAVRIFDVGKLLFATGGLPPLNPSKLKALSGIWVLKSAIFHQRLKVYHRESAVFWIIAQFFSCQALFQDPL